MESIIKGNGSLRSALASLSLEARNALSAQVAQLSAKPHEMAQLRAKRHLETVAKRTHPKPKGRGRMWRQAGMGGIKARIQFWQGSKATNWHEALA